MSGEAAVGNRVRRGFYLDSVALMRLSASIEARAGVSTASLMIGTPSNLAILDEAGLLAEEGRAAGPNDLVLAVRAAGEEALAAALDAAEASLDGAGAVAGAGAGAAGGPERRGGRPPERFPGMDAACDALPGANLAIVSVPGPFAAREARRALARGLHVLVFSDNVPVEEEAALKREARARGLLVMGPDCGTAIVAGTPLAFANRVRRGAVGVVAASGTGLQELSVLVHRGGGGLSHGIGVGGRDLADEIGGIGTFMALDALEADPATRHVVILSKPPGPRTEAALLTRIAGYAKPVTLYLVGRDGAELPPNAKLALTLRDAARLSLGGSGESGRSEAPGGAAGGGPGTAAGARGEGVPSIGRIVGLFSGGTLCAEGQAILRRAGLEVASNAPIPGAVRLAGAGPGGGFGEPVPAVRPRRAGRDDPGPAAASDPPDPAARHTFLDLGADEYTRGRPHPMIEPSVRAGALAAALADPTIAVVVLDLVLGVGSHPDPAASVAGALAADAPPPAGRASAGRERPAVVASVCGTELDPQGYAAQRRALESAGVFVAESNAGAVEAALRIAAASRGGDDAPTRGEGR